MDDNDFAPLRARLEQVMDGLTFNHGAASDHGTASDDVTAALARVRIGDGLPLTAPTPERVDALLGGRRADAPAAGPLPMSFAVPSWWELAACAAMAGCPATPPLLDVLAATLDAATDPTFNLLGVQSTTGAAAALVLVHGPIVDQLELHTGSNALGPNLSPNATLGRAVQLAFTTIGLARPGEGDMATHGHPGKFSWCVAERRGATSWPSLSTRRSAGDDVSAVTVAAGVGNVEVVLPVDDPDRLANILARALSGVARNGAVLLLPPDAAHYLDGQGWSLDRLVDELGDRSSVRPLVVVTGGPGIKSTLIPLWAGSTKPVTRPLH